MTQTTDIARTPLLPDVGTSIQQMMLEGSDWLTNHYVELIIATAVGTGFFFILGAIKRFAARYVRNNQNLTGYRTIIVTALARTSKFFMLMVSAELVLSFANAPPSFERLVHVLFTISMVVQVAIWLREIILGLIVRRTSQDPDQHETLENAMALIRLLVTV
ncbi:MAG: mechanosensitive ion channel family protein, partial [Parasphingorhabdus sp.]